MKTILKSPYLAVWSMLLIPFVLSVFNIREVVDINVGDTYFVMPYYYITVLLILVWGLLGLGYWGVYKLRRKLSWVLSTVHIFISFLFLIYLLSYLQLYSVEGSIYYNNFYVFSGFIPLIVLFFFLVVQLLYVINIVRAFVIKKTA